MLLHSQGTEARIILQEVCVEEILTERWAFIDEESELLSLSDDLGHIFARIVTVSGVSDRLQRPTEERERLIGGFMITRVGPS